MKRRYNKEPRLIKSDKQLWEEALGYEGRVNTVDLEIMLDIRKELIKIRKILKGAKEQ